jgi:hypothetical protein
MEVSDLEGRRASIALGTGRYAELTFVVEIDDGEVAPLGHREARADGAEGRHGRAAKRHGDASERKP